MAELSSISIVLLSHNRREALERNLNNLLLLVEEGGCELILVDNASTDGSPDLLRAFAAGKKNVVLVANEENLGVAGGRNSGWRIASRDFILNMDDDTLLTVEVAASLLAIMQRECRMAIVSPRIVHPTTREKQLSFADPNYRPSNFHGACHIVRRSTLNVIGFNDEGCTFGGEELDLSIRARAAGFEIGYEGHVTVQHDNLPRQGQDSRSRRERWLYNFTRIFYKHFPLRAALPFSLRYLVGHLVAGTGAHGPLFTSRLLRAMVRGIRDGRSQYRPVPNAVVQLYLDPTLRPEFGNVPISRKLWQKLAARKA